MSEWAARGSEEERQLSRCGREWSGRLWRAEMVWRGRSMRPRRGRRESDGRLRCGLPEGRKRRCACLRGAAKELRVCGDGSSRGRKWLRRGSVLGRRQRQLGRVAAGCCGLLRGRKGAAARSDSGSGDEAAGSADGKKEAESWRGRFFCLTLPSPKGRRSTSFRGCRGQGRSDARFRVRVAGLRRGLCMVARTQRECWMRNSKKHVAT